MFALDTNTVSYAMREQGDVARRLRELGNGQIALPAPVVYEVNYGLRRIGRRTQLEAFARMVGAVTVLDFDLHAADHAAMIRVHLDAAGTPIGTIDVLIAATARRHGCTLVTHNTREFARVPSLLLEDWY